MAAKDYYKLLQIEPGASAAAIEAAYQRLRTQFATVDLSGLAHELQVLHRERWEAITAAYAVLGDPDLRATYDLLRSDAVQDRPARLAFRGRDAGGKRPRGALTWPVGIMVGLVLLAIAGSGALLLRNRSPEATQSAAAEARREAWNGLPEAVRQQITDPTLLDMLVQQEQRIASLASTAPESRTAEDWVQLGNSTFDYVESIRSFAGEGEAYGAVAPRWLDAAEAYTEALKLRPADGMIRSDYAVSLLRFGAARGQLRFVVAAINEAEQAIRDDPNGLRTALNAGLVFAGAGPDRIDEARRLWTDIATRAPESKEGQVAKMLLDETAE